MRANKLMLAAALAISALQPVLASDLVRDIHETLYRPAHVSLLTGLPGGIVVPAGVGVMTRSAVVAAPAACGVDACNIETQPAVLAPAGACATAILTRDPSDLDIRREELARKISCVTGAVGACRAGELSAALTEINQAELAMRADGYLDTLESRRLYKAMDRLESHVDRWSRRSNLTIGSLLGLDYGVWY